MEFKTCDLSDIADAVALSRRVFKDNMGKQFIRLFHPENKDRMFIAKDESNVVRSLLCYYPSTVWMDGVSIRIGSVGSVCTEDSFRGKGLASTLLKHANDRMIKEGICVSVISGGGGIYEASGATLTGSMIECRMEHNRAIPSTVAIRRVKASDLERMWELNQAEAVRYDRTLDEFMDLYQGQTYPDTFATYPAWVVEKNGGTVAYVIGILDHGKTELGFKEYAGDREALTSSFASLMEETQRTSVHFAAVLGDDILSAPGLSKQPTTQHASLRLNDPSLFFMAIRPLANQNNLSDLEVSCDGSGWKIAQGGKEVRFQTIHELNRFVFGDWKPSSKRGSIDLQKKLAMLFPVKFPWTHNLNYQ
jgi:predicted N-acetyltransferase YhbS